MIKLKVHVKGITPLLQDNARIMGEKEPKNEEGRKKLLELQTYRQDDGYLYHPTLGLRKSFEEAAKLLKLGKSGSLHKLLSGWISFEPEEYFLLIREGKPIEKYDEVLTRTTINRSNKARIQKSNPLINTPWESNLIMLFDDTYTDAKLAEEIFIENVKTAFGISGKKIGIGAWSPRSGGKYGKYEVIIEKI